jgi:hypothetical protein
VRHLGSVHREAQLAFRKAKKGIAEAKRTPEGFKRSDLLAAPSPTQDEVNDQLLALESDYPGVQRVSRQERTITSSTGTPVGKITQERDLKFGLPRPLFSPASWVRQGSVATPSAKAGKKPASGAKKPGKGKKPGEKG